LKWLEVRRVWGKEEAVQRKPTGYEARGRALRERSKRGDKKAMEELYKRYHISQIMVNGELVNLKQKFGEPLSGL
jgi:hypothetical protein